MSLFFEILEFYTSSIELSDDGKMGRFIGNQSQYGKDAQKEEKKKKGTVCTSPGEEGTIFFLNKGTAHLGGHTRDMDLPKRHQCKNKAL